MALWLMVGVAVEEIDLAAGIHSMRVSYFQGPRLDVALVLRGYQMSVRCIGSAPTIRPDWNRVRNNRCR